MDRMILDGVALEVQRITAPAGGRRAPIVFLHEGLGSVAMWRDWPARVCELTHREGVIYSRRGYGTSDPIPDVRASGRLPANYMHREAWDVLPALLQSLGLVSPVLLGHSDGGSIALLHAARHPVSACIVMAPHVMVEEVSLQAISAARDAYLQGDLRERLGRYHHHVDCAFWQWNDVWLSESFRTFDLRAECRTIRAPVLALQGLDDPYGTLRQVDEIAPTAGIFERIALPDCGHSPHRDQPHATVQHIAHFLQTLA